MSKQHPRSSSNTSQPSRWCREQRWRCPFPNDEKQARALRRALYEIGVYPHYDLATNENLDGWEANSRTALPDMIAALDRTDVIAVAELVRLLAVVPRKGGLLRGRRCRPLPVTSQRPQNCPKPHNRL